MPQEATREELLERVQHIAPVIREHADRGEQQRHLADPNLLVNCYANKSSNEITFPIGLQISKVIKIGPLPVKLAVQGQYMPIHPDVFGQKWNLQFAVTPVIPKLIKANIFGD